MRNSLITAITAGLALIFTGCASTKRHVVWERIGEQDETPEWTSGEKPHWEEDDSLVFVHVVSTQIGQPEGCLRVAEEGAKARVLRHIKDNFTSSGQTTQTGLDADSYGEALTTWIAAGSLQGITTEERYWERLVDHDPTGKQSLRIRCAARVKVSKAQIERQKASVAAISRGTVNATVQDAQNKKVEQFISEVGQP